MENESNPPRKFTGLWIPAEIWDLEGLPIMAKILWAEIKALSGKGSCFASNGYFVKRLGIKERQLQVLISKLKELKLIEQIGFDGRKRYLKASYINTYEDETTQGLQVWGAEKCTSARYKNAPIDNSIDNKEKKEVSKDTSKEKLKIRSNISLTQNELNKLQNKMSQQELDNLLDTMEEWLYATGRKYKDYYHAILMWHSRTNTQSASKQYNPDNFHNESFRGKSVDFEVISNES